MRLNYLELDLIKEIGVPSLFSFSLVEFRGNLMETIPQVCSRTKDKENTRNKHWKYKAQERRLKLGRNPLAFCASVGLIKNFPDEHAECHLFYRLHKKRPPQGTRKKEKSALLGQTL